ncbi:hypothetical protein Tdes44962_MAKER07803 [Teratosphaeria destructans]|uniref:Uncharacterized protein n=1 Tax=Teratosphaeria destructans TaxID=418781 RepID=A0A9W7SY28_9PEZI|nr:hypothetical protein Tdes44962_MAKER07803 [Teratosphaeria destructans]
MSTKTKGRVLRGASIPLEAIVIIDHPNINFAGFELDIHQQSQPTSTNNTNTIHFRTSTRKLIIMAPNVHLQIVPTRDAITETSARLSTLEQDDTSGYVVTVDFTNGLESGLSASEFAELLVEGVTEEIAGAFELELLHRDPEAGRSAAAVAAHDEILTALACAFTAGLWSCKGVKKLTIKGMSCTSGLDELMERLEDPGSITLESLTLPEEDVLALFDDNIFSELPGLENLTLRDVSLLGPGQTHATADATRVPLLEPLRLQLPNEDIDLRRSFSGEDGGEPGSLELYPEENMVVMTCYDAMSEARRTLWPDE